MTLKIRRADVQHPEVGWPANDGHLVILHGETVIGTLNRAKGGPADNSWKWSLTRFYVPPGVTITHGREDTKDEAIAAFTRALRTFLTHIGADGITDEVIRKHSIGTRR
jgi:hypothetical protein